MAMAAILIVDDEPSARLTLGLLLRHRGHLVREADSVTAATSALGADAFDVVITDLRMPDGLGLDVLQAGKARCAASTARAASAGPPSATLPITSPVAGSDTAKVPPSAASIHSPSTNIR